MGIYIVEVEGWDWNNLFVVRAKSEKDAKVKVWESELKDTVNPDMMRGYEPVKFSDLSAKSVDGLLEDEDVACLV